jgi:GAF domain-containing protein
VIRDASELHITENLHSLRLEILNHASIGLFILGVFTLAAAIPSLLEEKRTVSAVLTGLILIWQIVIAFWRSINYPFRAVSFLIILLLLSVSTMGDDRFLGTGRSLLFALPIFAIIFLGVHFGIVGLLLTWGVVASKDFLNLFGMADFSIFGGSSSPFSPAATTYIYFVLVSGVLFNSLLSTLKTIEVIKNNEKELGIDLQSEKSQLERRVQLRTQDLEKRLSQSQMVLKILKKTFGNLEPSELMNQLCNSICDEFELLYVGYWELDEEGAHLVLKLGSQRSDPNRKSLPVASTSAAGGCLIHRKSLVAFDTNKDWPLLDHSLVPQARSELAIPLLASEMNIPDQHALDLQPLQTCYGAFVFYSDKPLAFSKDDIGIYQMVVDGATLAYENARLFQQVLKRYEESNQLTRQYIRDAWSKVKTNQGMLSFTDEGDPAKSDEKSLQSYKMPIILREQVIGLLSMENFSSAEGEVTLLPEDQAFVDTILTEAALAMESSRLLQETQKRAANERLLSELSQKAYSASDIDSILRITVKAIAQGMNASEALIQLVVPQGTDDADEPANRR